MAGANRSGAWLMWRRRVMPAAVRELIDRELRESRGSADPWPGLERAHIVSQPWALPHTKVHWVMLNTAFAQRDRGEVVGQIVRLIVAGPGSLVGRYPVGNTGRTTMGLTEAAPIPSPLAAMLEDADKASSR